MFKIDPDINVGSTYLIGSFLVSPARLISVFGRPIGGDRGKIYGEYYFSGEDGARFTLYDWKREYNCWDENHNESVTLHIGGDEKSKLYLADFKSWLISQTTK